MLSIDISRADMSAAQPCTHLCAPDTRITEIVACLEWGDFGRLWLSRMVTSEGVGGVKTGNDTSRTKFFILTDGQLFSSPITNENRSDRNCPIPASAVGPARGGTAFSGGSSLFAGRTPQPELREGRGRINVLFIRAVALPLINALPINQYEAGLARVPYMTENKSYRCRSPTGVLLRGWVALAVQRLQQTEELKQCPWLGSQTPAWTPGCSKNQ